MSHDTYNFSIYIYINSLSIPLEPDDHQSLARLIDFCNAIMKPLFSIGGCSSFWNLSSYQPENWKGLKYDYCFEIGELQV
ncbi:hypothetical protein L1987_39469 [Smallanthus sonchifolius]|uniref:Uncharacterized protein n=1 Tax=Smallanthus sonchifolius TaxID=185202 RepID=A0ACB9HLX3_9ASTR|nr:hypothetical protein L1987_39469 [Smallanthus sonchifolius]